jgi:lipopolysaccharide transport system permease protein
LNKKAINDSIHISVNSSSKKYFFLELFDYKDLFYFLIKREISVLYKQTSLGISWAIIKPVFLMVIFSFVFGGIAKLPSDGLPYPVFSYIALVPWTYFSTSLNRSSNSLISYASIFTKVYFPRVIIPLVPVFAGLLDFIIAMFVVVFLMGYYSITPTVNIIFFPVLVLIMMLFSSGLGMLFSAMAVQYRDVKFIVQFLSQLLMYVAPIVWPLSLLTDKYGSGIKPFLGFYPMIGVVEGFRSMVIPDKEMPLDLIIIGAFSSLIIFFIGVIYFKKKEISLADVV